MSKWTKQDDIECEERAKENNAKDRFLRKWLKEQKVQRIKEEVENRSLCVRINEYDENDYKALFFNANKDYFKQTHYVDSSTVNSVKRLAKQLDIDFTKDRLVPNRLMLGFNTNKDANSFQKICKENGLFSVIKRIG